MIRLLRHKFSLGALALVLISAGQGFANAAAISDEDISRHYLLGQIDISQAYQSWHDATSPTSDATMSSRQRTIGFLLKNRHGITTDRQAVILPPNASQVDQAHQWLLQANLQLDQGHPKEAREAVFAAKALLEPDCASLKDQSQCDQYAWWLLQMISGELSAFEGADAQALAQFDLAQKAATLKGDTYAQLAALFQRTQVTLDENQVDKAREHLKLAQTLLEPLDDSLSQKYWDLMQVKLLVVEQNYVEAQKLVEAALQNTKALGPTLTLQFKLMHVKLLLGRRQLPSAIQAGEALLPQLANLPINRIERAELMLQIGLGRVLARDLERGNRDVENAITLLKERGGSAGLQRGLRRYAEAMAEIGRYEQAVGIVHRELDVMKQASSSGREYIVKDLRERYDQYSQSMAIEAKKSEHKLQEQAQENRQAELQFWVMVLLIGVASLFTLGMLMVRNVRSQRALTQQQETLRLRSLTDQLTGLSNRLAFHQRLTQERAASETFVGTLLLCDIDFFKKINDRYGHNGGDLVLKSVAKTLQQSLPADSMVARWGGEEFVIHLESDDPEQAQALAQRLVSSVAAHPIPVSETIEAPVTISLGYACFNALQPSDGNWEKALQHVDQALYYAKEHGRNQCVDWHALPSRSINGNSSSTSPQPYANASKGLLASMSAS